MANVQNDGLSFEDAGAVRAIVSEYTDANSNVWRITAVGQAAVVSYLQERKGLLIVAEPADEPRSLPGPEPREYRGKGEPGREVALLAELEVTIELIELHTAPPYRIAFLIDPPLGPNAWQTYYINIENDTQTTADFSADYSVNVRLYKKRHRSPCANVTAVSGSLSCSGTGYYIRVTNQTGNPNDFTLSGDINVG